MTPLEKWQTAKPVPQHPTESALSAMIEQAIELAAVKPVELTQIKPVELTERRVAKRASMQAVIDLTSDSNFYAGFSTDVSNGGLFVATVYVLPVGAHVDLSFSLPTGERISTHGIVRWTREVNDQVPDSFPGMGIQFASLSQVDREAIERFVRSREPMFFPD